MHMIHSIKHTQGIGLIEVLISVFVLGIGLIGVSSMQVSSIKMNQGAYAQSQANIIMTEIFDRMRLNRDAFLAGAYDDLDTNEDPPSAQTCVSQSSGCTGTQLASHDIREFVGFFNDVNNQGSDFVALIPGGRATVTRDASTNVATVTVFWDQDVWSRLDGVVEKNNSVQQVSMSVRI